jgi:hypothetical protein
MRTAFERDRSAVAPVSSSTGPSDREKHRGGQRRAWQTSPVKFNFTPRRLTGLGAGLERATCRGRDRSRLKRDREGTNSTPLGYFPGPGWLPRSGFALSLAT